MKNLFTEKSFRILCLLFVVVYLYLNFKTVNQAVLFLAAIFLIYFSSIFLNIFFRSIIIRKYNFVVVLRDNWKNLLFILLSIVLIYFLGSWQLLSAIFYGLMIYAFLFGIYYLFILLKKVKKK